MHSSGRVNQLKLETDLVRLSQKNQIRNEK